MLTNYKSRVRQKLFSDYRGIFLKEKSEDNEIKAAITRAVDDIIRLDNLSAGDEERMRMIEELVNEFIGYGPIEKLMQDPQVTEIMINGPKKVYAERAGHTVLTDVTFDDERQIMVLVYKILGHTRRRVDELFPYTEVSLKDGSRVNIIIPPLALDGPTLTIRKFMKEIKSADDLVKLGTFDERMSKFLVAAIKAKLNIIFSGATGAGKTTTLNVLSSYIPEDDRVITIEDTAELRLSQEHVVRLETRQPSIEGKGEITIRDLFKNSLRMRPDRIIIGEIRSSEALDMLQAICSGHTGSLAVLHANSPEDTIYRLETMILASGIPISLEAIHRQLNAAINIVVQQEQLLDGSRKITHIAQINGMKEGRVRLEDIFIYDIEEVKPDGTVTGRWKATGVTPLFMDKFKKSGVDLPMEIFKKD